MSEQEDRDTFRQLRHLPPPQPQYQRPYPMLANVANPSQAYPDAQTYGIPPQSPVPLHVSPRTTEVVGIQEYTGTGPASWTISRVAPQHQYGYQCPYHSAASAQAHYYQVNGQVRYIQTPVPVHRGPSPQVNVVRHNTPVSITPLPSPLEPQQTYYDLNLPHTLSAQHGFPVELQSQTISLPAPSAYSKESAANTTSQASSQAPSQAPSQASTPAPTTEPEKKESKPKPKPRPLKLKIKTAPSPTLEAEDMTTTNAASLAQEDISIPAESAILCEFEMITAHTAKCDVCNQRNGSGMSRCLTCGWQSCHACTIARGCLRTHHAAKRVHTGPVDRNTLLADENNKGKKRTRIQQKKTEVAAQPRPERTVKKPRGKKTVQEESEGTAPTSQADAVDDIRTTNVEDLSPAMIGARNLYAFSLEATALAELKEESEKKRKRLNSQRHQDPEAGDDDATEVISDNSPQDRYLEELRGRSLKQANVSMEKYLKEKAAASNTMESDNNVDDTSPEADAPLATRARPKTKAQVYERKRAGKRATR